MKTAKMWFALFATSVMAHGGTLYLSPDGSDETGDGSADNPLQNVKTAIAAADAAIAGGETEMTIYLAPGTYPITDGPATVANPISLIGQGDAPTDVIVQSSYKSSGWGASQDYGVFVLNHADAVLSNLRVNNGFVLAWTGLSTKAAGVHISAGTVENCHITNCHSGGNNNNAGGLYLASASAVAKRCVISNCQVSHTNAQSWQGSRGGGVWMQGGRMEDCLIQGCYIDIGTIPEGKKYAGALLISGGTVVNCTFLNNRAKSTGGVSASGSAALWNCAIAANTIYSPDENTGANDHAFVGNTTYYHNCASDTAEPINATCVTGTAADLFADFANGDYSPRFGSGMINGGDNTAVTETTDLAGEQRIKGPAVDIGAYEAETRIAITVEVEASDYGTVVVSDGPYYAGEDITFTATPNEGCVFLCWDGDVPTALLETASITFAPEANSVVFPRFAPAGSGPVVYVATNGNDANDGFSAEAPKATMRGAVATLEGSYGYGTVLVAPGTYSDPTPFVVTRPVAVLGTGSAPSDVVLRANGWYSGTAADHRVAILDNAGASLVNVTMENGFICNWDNQPSVHGFLAGANVSILAGVVSNCVIQAGRGEGWWARSAGAYVGGDNALLTHSIVRNNRYTQGEQSWGGLEATGGVRIQAGRVENCLIYGNSVNDTIHNGSAGAVRAFGGTIANCTIYGNTGQHMAGIHLSDNAQAYNLAILENTIDNGETLAPWGGSASHFHNCGTDGEEAINESCTRISRTAFRDFANGNLVPVDGGPLHNKGAAVTLATNFDFAGKPRVQGSSIDIGAFESQYSGTAVLVR